jgi:dTDP-L-rhamnose 4-epimerase
MNGGTMNVLITGGAGFIGSRLAISLAGQGATVTILDNLSPQVHGADARFAEPLRSVARCVKGDICDSRLVQELLQDQEAVVHLAAETGTGQSMYAVERYGRVNMQGTAVLLDRIVNARPKSLHKLIVASSRAVYGEGEYACETHGHVYPAARTAAAMSAGRFEPVCPQCGRDVAPVATGEATPFGPSSFYGLTKQMQEQMVLMFAGAIGLDAFALRYQNVYGPGQSLTNPYTGILAIFSNLVRQGTALNIFEDGEESRDFVYIDDVVAATASCMAPEVRGVMALNVGSGVRTSVLDVAHRIVRHFGVDVPVNITGDFRTGDIRHNYADISRIARLTGFSPKWSFDDGMRMFLSWAGGQASSDAGFERSLAELQALGLMQTGSGRA